MYHFIRKEKGSGIQIVIKRIGKKELEKILSEDWVGGSSFSWLLFAVSAAVLLLYFVCFMSLYSS